MNIPGSYGIYKIILNDCIIHIYSGTDPIILPTKINYLLRSNNAFLNIPFVECNKQLVESTNRDRLTTQVKTAVHREDHLDCITL